MIFNTSKPKKSGGNMLLPTYDEVIAQWRSIDLLSGTGSSGMIPPGSIIAFAGDAERNGTFVSFIPMKEDSDFAIDLFVVDEEDAISLVEVRIFPEGKYLFFNVSVLKTDANEDNEKPFKPYIYIY